MKTDLVVTGCLIHENKLLLIHHKKLDLWLPVGGHIDENETPDGALKREFREEVGTSVLGVVLNRVVGNIKKELALPFYVNVHNVGDHDHCSLTYLCIPKNPDEISINKNEVKDFRWFSKEELQEEIVPPDIRNIGLKALKMFN